VLRWQFSEQSAQDSEEYPRQRSACKPAGMGSTRYPSDQPPECSNRPSSSAPGRHGPPSSNAQRGHESVLSRLSTQPIRWSVGDGAASKSHLIPNPHELRMPPLTPPREGLLHIYASGLPLARVFEEVSDSECKIEPIVTKCNELILASTFRDCSFAALGCGGWPF
jgi:hypothetical protein